MTQSWKNGSASCDFDATEDFVGNAFLVAGTFYSIFFGLNFKFFCTIFSITLVK